MNAHATITAKGRELADKLNPAIGTTREIERTCSLIARHATSHHGLQERLCNGGDDWLPDDARHRQIERLEALDEALERRITALVETLPHTDDGPFGVKFGGDPRGCTVKITAPAMYEHLYDDWGREGICVPQEHR